MSVLRLSNADLIYLFYLKLRLGDFDIHITLFVFRWLQFLNYIPMYKIIFSNKRVVESVKCYQSLTVLCSLDGQIGFPAATHRNTPQHKFRDYYTVRNGVAPNTVGIIDNTR